jgi:glycosyltransferase involved in cell wall biosynthesis
VTLPEVSVVIPTYNGSRFIAEALRSVFAQSHLPCEIIVVDDCSTDNTLGVVEGLRGESPIPVRVLQLDQNSGGPAKPINTSVNASVGEVVLVLDQDDLLAPEALRRGAEALATVETAAFAFHWAGPAGDASSGPIQPEELRQRVLELGTCERGHVVFEPMQLLPEIVNTGTFVVGFPGFLFRKNVWERKGGVNESLRIAVDLDFLCWMVQHESCVLIPEIGYFRREHDGNACGNRPLLFVELARVLAATVSALPESQRGPLAEPTAQKIAGFAYWFREAHRYKDSLELYDLIDTVRGGRAWRVIDRVKLCVHWCVTRLSRRSPVFSGYTRVAK